MNKETLIDKDGEVRELTPDELKKFKPLAEANPSLFAKIKKSVGERGSQKAPIKVPISIRVSSEVVDYFRAEGKGWQSRIDHVLKDYVAHHK